MNTYAKREAADRGFDAAMRGELRGSNPYSPNSELAAWWDLGWLEYDA